jgi:hypothetical protein
LVEDRIVEEVIFFVSSLCEEIKSSPYMVIQKLLILKANVETLILWLMLVIFHFWDNHHREIFSIIQISNNCPLQVGLFTCTPHETNVEFGLLIFNIIQSHSNFLDNIWKLFINRISRIMLRFYCVYAIKPGSQQAPPEIRIEDSR